MTKEQEAQQAQTPISYAKGIKSLKDANPDYAVPGAAVYMHVADVAKMFRLYSWLVHKNDTGDIDSGDELIEFRKKLIRWESL